MFGPVGIVCNNSGEVDGETIDLGDLYTLKLLLKLVFGDIVRKVLVASCKGKSCKGKNK
jgi:hypothetical protein